MENQDLVKMNASIVDIFGQGVKQLWRFVSSCFETVAGLRISNISNHLDRDDWGFLDQMYGNVVRALEDIPGAVSDENDIELPDDIHTPEAKRLLSEVSALCRAYERQIVRLQGGRD